MNNLKPGDIVQLASGGPAMTVKSRYDQDSVNCQWFDKNGELKHAIFNDASLVKDSEPR